MPFEWGILSVVGWIDIEKECFPKVNDNDKCLQEVSGDE